MNFSLATGDKSWGNFLKRRAFGPSEKSERRLSTWSSCRRSRRNSRRPKRLLPLRKKQQLKKRPPLGWRRKKKWKSSDRGLLELDKPCWRPKTAETILDTFTSENPRAHLNRNPKKAPGPLHNPKKCPKTPHFRKIQKCQNKQTISTRKTSRPKMQKPTFKGLIFCFQVWISIKIRKMAWIHLAMAIEFWILMI